MPQVTEKLLEAEEKKLRVLKAEIEASKHMDKDSSKVGQKADVVVVLMMHNH